MVEHGEPSELVRAAVASTGFSGVVSVTRGEEVLLESAYGLAHRAGIANTTGTRFAMASGSKAFTALAVIRLVEQGVLDLDTPIRPILGTDLPLIDDAVTVEHLLEHTSGIGDYLDESTLSAADYVLSRPVHLYLDAESFLPDLAGHPQVSPPGERYVYNNGGYLVLALVAARASGRDYHELVRTEVLERAGLLETEFLRSDRLPIDAATGYIETTGTYTNVLHLPVLGGGDGGAYTTASDMRTFWSALLAGRIVGRDWVDAMTRPRHYDEEEELRYALGFWLHPTGSAVLIEGCDAGVSFRSTHEESTGLTVSVLSNTTAGAWPVVWELTALFGS